jgi:hypothetical protein
MTDDIDLPDDATRPEIPVLENLTDQELEPGRHLAMIHDHQRQNMRVLRGLIETARSGTLSSADLDAAEKDMSLISNYRRFGSLCGQHCHIVHTHHSIEDSYVFPQLSDKAEAFRRVVARLVEEHEIVHTLLVRLLDELSALIDAPAAPAFETAVATYDKLETLLTSHFSYEERSIGPALGRFGIGV